MLLKAPSDVTDVWGHPVKAQFVNSCGVRKQWGLNTKLWFGAN